MKKMNKKGFTVVELVIVIAVIAVLAAVLIPTFAGIIHKADVSNDTQLVKNLNTALAADTTKNVTMTDALEAAAEFGYDIEKINASATDNEILWDGANNLFCYFNDGKIEYIPESTLKVPADQVKDYQYWVISNKLDTKYSTYFIGNIADIVDENNTVNLTTNFDAGKVDTSAVILSYTNTDAPQTVAIRMNGGELVVDAEKDTVNKFGTAESVDIKAVAMESFHEYGKTNFTKITKGNYVLENGGSTNAIVNAAVNEADVKISTDRAIGGKEITPYTVTDATEIEKIKNGATKFAGGIGTEEKPYLIETAEHMQNITEYYEKGFKWFKIKEGVTAIDCSGWASVKLNGSFNGNGVVFNNVTDHLFSTVGYQNNEAEIVLQNFDANMNLSKIGSYSSSALVRNIFNSGVTVFDNVDVHGYIEGFWNSASYYNYGPANLSGSEGADYTVKFVNCKSDATLVCTTGNVMAGFIGHAYEGKGNTFSLYIDENSEYTGTIYTTNGKGHKYYCMSSDIEKGIIFNDEGITWTDEINQYENSKTLTKVVPEKGDANYTVDKLAGVSTIAVVLTAQVTATDADGNKIPNYNGLTWTISSTEITEFDGDVVDVFTADFAEGKIVNNTEELKLVVEDGILTLYTGSSVNYTEGVFRLQVNQYDINGNVIACGTVELVSVK